MVKNLISRLTLSSIGHDCIKIAITFAAASCAGWLFLQAGLPAPYLMGSLFGVWLLGASLAPLRPQLGVAQWFRIPIILGLGVLIGASFGLDFFDNLSRWWVTALIMVITTFLICLMSYSFLTKWRGYDKMLAYFCCIPGGQAEALIMAHQLTEKDYVVALFHLVRVAVIFISMPLLLGLSQGQEAVSNSNVMMENMPHLWHLPATDLLALIGVALGGFVVARLIRMPLPHLLGPIMLSAALHISGALDLPRVNEFVILAQLTIGGSIGARLARVPFREVFRYLQDAIINLALTLGAFLLVAYGISYALHQSFLTIWMGFVPGGLYEVTLLGLLFGFDVAFIAFHHTARIMILFFTMPFVATLIKKTQTTP